MDYQAFLKSIERRQKPAALHPFLEALWLEATGDWDSAHRIVQSYDEADAEWVHAYLHRKEGDSGNASYWYARCGKQRPDMDLREEWALITKTLLKKYA